jgi:hypothetical protein
MIYNLSTILRETMKQTNKNKEKDEVRQIPHSLLHSFLKNKDKPKSPYNLTIDIELANRKSIELYKKYNTNTSIVPKFRILEPDSDKDSDKALVENKPNKRVLTICGICFFAFLAYSYLKKK